MPLPDSALKLSRTLARDEAYGKLRDWIIAGTLQPGEVLHDQDIAATLGVSRTPVREALRRLEDEGFVETALNRWTRVAPLDLTRAAETYAVVEALELLAIELAFSYLVPEDTRRLSVANRAMREAAEQHDAVAAVTADEAFHQVWISRAGNTALATLLGPLKAKLRRVELAYFDAAAPARHSFREHAAIIRTVRKGSLPQARAALRRNWRGSLERLRALVETSNTQPRTPDLPNSLPSTSNFQP
jgi:DNA-binding GntR family transcriptional regulator